MSIKATPKKEPEIDLDDIEESTENVMGAIFDDAMNEFIRKGDGEDGEKDGDDEEEEKEGREEESVEDDPLRAAADDDEEEEEKKEAIQSFDDEGQEDPVEGETEEAVYSSDVAAPSHWDDEAKEEFDTLPPKQQEQISKISRGMQSDFDKTMNGFKGIANALQPINEECLQRGLTYEDAIRKFVGIHSQLLSDPVTGIRTVMETYGVTPENVLGVNPNGRQETPDSRRIADLEAQVHSTQQNFINQQAAAIDAQVEEFKKTAQHYDEVEQDMIALVGSHQAAGQAIPPLKELYDRACWANPSVRGKLLAEREAGGAKDKVNQRKEQLAKSKRASRTVKRGGGQKQQAEKPPKTLHDILSRNWDKAEKNQSAGG